MNVIDEKSRVTDCVKMRCEKEKLNVQRSGLVSCFMFGFAVLYVCSEG